MKPLITSTLVALTLTTGLPALAKSVSVGAETNQQPLPADQAAAPRRDPGLPMRMDWAHLQAQILDNNRPGDRTNLGRWTDATVSQRTTARSLRGQELFEFQRGERIQVNRNDVRTFNDDDDNRDYIAAITSSGRRGYIRLDRVDRYSARPDDDRPDDRPGGRWTNARVTQSTTARSANGRELFEFRRGEQIQVNREEVRTISDGETNRSYVIARNSNGQRGYVRADRVDGLGTRPGDDRPDDRLSDRWTDVRVTQATTARSANGRELFEFRQGEQIQVNREEVRPISDGGSNRNYVAARNRNGQRGYIRLDRVSR